jgi:hypothetical protein
VARTILAPPVVKKNNSPAHVNVASAASSSVLPVSVGASPTAAAPAAAAAAPAAASLAPTAPSREGLSLEAVRAAVRDEFAVLQAQTFGSQFQAANFGPPQMRMQPGFAPMMPQMAFGAHGFLPSPYGFLPSPHPGFPFPGGAVPMHGRAPAHSSAAAEGSDDPSDARALAPSGGGWSNGWDPSSSQGR